MTANADLAKSLAAVQWNLEVELNLTAFSNLVHLHLYGRELTGSIHKEIGTLTKLSYLDLTRYDKVTQSWWLVPNRPLQTSLRDITDDKELMEMCYLAQKNKGVIHVYYKHGVSEPLYNEKVESVSSKGKELMSQIVFVALSSSDESSDSIDSDDNVEDEPYRSGGDEVSSEEEEVAVKRSAGKKTNGLRMMNYFLDQFLSLVIWHHIIMPKMKLIMNLMVETHGTRKK
ncbi:hypothetical protein Ahy_B06g084584 [Arachis hypogaea]|uniref:PB1-like domain-containing protein n=1 Tax=Arachis hypogaea TaxID=3818 RepID=A0A444YSA9_ARAHY|nr:hypothetical protein Ahy_B06g084584 [Arachis hypogaea]